MMERCWNKDERGQMCGRQATHFDADLGIYMCDACAALRAQKWAVVERRLFRRRVVKRGLTDSQAVEMCRALNRWHPQWPTDLIGYFAHTEAEVDFANVGAVA